MRTTHFIRIACVAATALATTSALGADARTDLSKKAATLKIGMTRPKVIAKLGKPTWVMLPGDKSDFAPPPGITLALMWDNSPCEPVEVLFDQSGKVNGWAEGRALCAEKGPSEFNPPKGRFSCKEERRARYCR